MAPEELAYGYTGKWQREKDLATGQIRMGVREYDPGLGRFTAADPLKGKALNPQTRNRYEYALNNPLRYNDLNGLYPGESIVDAVEGTISDAIDGGVSAFQEESTLDSFIAGAAESYWDNWKSGFDSMSTGEQITLVAVPATTAAVAVGVEAAGVGGTVIATDTLITGTGGLLARTGLKCADKGTKAASVGERILPRSLAEKLALDEAKGGAGTRIMAGKVGDPRYPESLWAKMRHVHQNPDGTNIVLHYWENLQTGVREGFKFK